LEFLENNLTAD